MTSLETRSSLTDLLAEENEKLLACIHCGLCLQACPTYVQTGDENDSPRGRIYLMRAVREGRLHLDSPSFEEHISRCLGCRACEQACPSGVQYGQLLEAARNELFESEVSPRASQHVLRMVLRHVWSRPWLLRLSFQLTKIFRATRLPRLAVRTGLARRLSPRLEFALALLDVSMPARLGDETISRQEMATNRTKGEAGTASLFTGCVMEGLFSRVNRATARVLEVNGCKVNVPGAQGCCGALHAHAGDLEGARVLARRNIEAFEKNGEAPIITNAGGCGAMLASYDHLLAGDSEYVERARVFAGRVKDISQQLASVGIREGAPVTNAAVTYDASCHLIYGQHAGNAPIRMLQAIPGLKLVPLEGCEMCCGGAGVYNLLEPEMSTGVLMEKLENIRRTEAAVVATGNPGCHMQLGAGAQLNGLRIDVCHPVELLDKSYELMGFYNNSGNPT